MQAHDVPDTPEVRAKLAAAQAEALARFGLDPEVVAVSEDGFRSVDELDHSFEWWYFDMHLDDGSTLVATFNTKPNTAPDGPLDPSVLVIYHGADRYADPRRRPSSGRGLRGHCGPLRRADRVEHGDRRPRPLRTAPERRRRRCRPVDRTARPFVAAGRGDQLLRLGDYTVVYVRMTTKGVLGFGALNVPTFYLAKGDKVLTDNLLPLRLETRGDVAGPGHQSYPSELEWTWRKDSGSVTMRVADVEMIEALDMARPRHGRGQAILHAVDHPMYYDFNTDVKLTVKFDSVDETVYGRTLFEKMMFR